MSTAVKKKTVAKKMPSESPRDFDLGYEAQQAAAGWLRIGDARIKVNPAEAQKILRIRDELRDEGAELPDGRIVTVPLDAVRWVFINQIQMRQEE